MWNHRRNSITTNWYIDLCIDDDRCIRHSSSIILRQTRVKYITDLGALAKTNPILAMTIDAFAIVPAVLFTGLSKVWVVKNFFWLYLSFTLQLQWSHTLFRSHIRYDEVSTRSKRKQAPAFLFKKMEQHDQWQDKPNSMNDISQPNGIQKGEKCQINVLVEYICL